VRIPFDRVADIYDRTRGLPEKVMKKTVGVLAKELKDNRRVLEIGVGTGRFAKPLQESHFEIVGIDIARDMMSKAKHKSVSNLLLADAYFLPFREKSFDAALSVHVLHLIKDWQTALHEISRVTRDALLSVVNMPSRNPVSKAYEDLAEEKGYDAHRLGLGEREIKDKIKPAKTVPAASMVAEADKYLTNLSRRAYSRQWRVPENVNKEIVEELTRRFAGQEYTLEIYVVKWLISDIKSYLDSAARR